MKYAINKNNKNFDIYISFEPTSKSTDKLSIHASLEDNNDGHVDYKIIKQAKVEMI